MTPNETEAALLGKYEKELERQRQLKEAHEKLSEAQRKQLDDFCATLEVKESYKTAHALKAAELIRTEEGRKLSSELQYLSQRADQQALEDYHKAVAEAERQKEYRAEKAEKQKAARAADAEKAKQQEHAKQDGAEKTPSEQREPSTMARFSAILAASKAEKEAQTHAGAMEKAAKAAEHRPNHARHNELKQTQEPARSAEYSDKNQPRGEISEAKAERLTRMFNRPSSDKDFDPTHDPSNTHNFSNGRGGRGR